MHLLDIVGVHVVVLEQLEQACGEVDAVLLVRDIRLDEGPHLAKQLASTSPIHAPPSALRELVIRLTSKATCVLIPISLSRILLWAEKGWATCFRASKWVPSKQVAPTGNPSASGRVTSLPIRLSWLGRTHDPVRPVQRTAHRPAASAKVGVAESRSETGPTSSTALSCRRRTRSISGTPAGAAWQRPPLLPRQSPTRQRSGRGWSPV